MQADCTIDIYKIDFTPTYSQWIIKHEFKKTIPFIRASKRIKYLHIVLTKERQYLYIDNYKTLLKK
jgi:hypothetical protein